MNEWIGFRLGFEENREERYRWAEALIPRIADLISAKSFGVFWCVLVCFGVFCLAGTGLVDG